ncbi:hypothetical protein [Aquabacterium commune]|uniref:hypothetical protein n=1 Tax=Aquabacterium commune TaxID=70586 RepID=UPI00105C6A7B|nr:hypothetical protein [Aquabacterium commune]
MAHLLGRGDRGGRSGVGVFADLRDFADLVEPGAYVDFVGFVGFGDSCEFGDFGGRGDLVELAWARGHDVISLVEVTCEASVFSLLGRHTPNFTSAQAFRAKSRRIGPQQGPVMRR